MGQVSSLPAYDGHSQGSQPTGLLPGIAVQNPARFFVSAIQVMSGIDESHPLLSITCDRKTSSINAVSSTSGPLEFVLDPNSSSPATQPSFLLKVPYRGELTFKFTLNISVTQNTPIDNLTFVSASSGKELKNFISTELFHNPNIQNEDNVVLLGDIVAPELPPVSGKTAPPTLDYVHNTKMQFRWTWTPPPGSSSATLNESGYKTSACFAEYVKREHSLQQLAKFSMWVESPQTALGLGRPISPPPVGIGITGVSGSDVNASPSSPTAENSISFGLPKVPNSPAVQARGPIPIPQRTNSMSKNVVGGESVGSVHVGDASLNSSIGNLNTGNSSLKVALNATTAGASSSSSTTSLSHSPTIQTGRPIPQQEPLLSKDHLQQALSTSLPSQPLTSSVAIQDLNSPESIGKVILKEKSSITIPRPDDGSVSQPEDGPLFRATIASLEKKTGNLKVKIKKVLKRASFLYERELSVAESQQLFVQALADAAATEVPAFKSIVYNYFDKRQRHADFFRHSAVDLNNHVIEPLRKLYDLEIKSFDSRKREFDDESSQYYSWLSRYLSMKQESKGKKKDESVAKYLEKRKAFELRRFDYYSYMQDLHGGRKQQEVTYQLALFAEAEVNRMISLGDKLRSSVKPSLDGIVSEVKNANKDWSRQRADREDKRRALEMSIISSSNDVNITEIPITATSSAASRNPNLTTKENSGHRHPSLRIATGGTGVLGPSAPIGSPKISSAVEKNSGFYDDVITSNEDDSEYYDYDDYDDTANSAINTNTDNNPNINLNTTNSNEIDHGDIEKSTSNEESRKEGLLWAMSRPGGFSDPIPNLNKQGWHKFWVVLAGGKLCEYTNWKQGVDLHNEPINLKVALVREARNTDRRFCFEVVTPNYKRVYQATSDDDMNSWIKSINSGISSSLEQNNNSTVKGGESSLPRGTDSRTFRRVLSSSSSEGEGHHRDDRRENLSNKMKPRGIVDNVSSTTGSIADSVTKPSTKEVNNDLLDLVHKLSPSNYKCADCGSTTKTEWISINLLVILCIDCSGVHRSLGSHISKIRSLTLDTVSFTPELIDLIQSVNNSEVNSIWEKRLTLPRPTITENNRRSFITEKYVEKKFLQPLERPNAELRKAVQQQDVKEVLRALASRANPNLSVPIDPSVVASPGAPTGVGADENRNEPLLLDALRYASSNATRFPIAELLILNSATVPHKFSQGLSNAAIGYIRSKVEKEASINVSGSATHHQPRPPSDGNSFHVHNGAPRAVLHGPGLDKKNNVGSKIQKRLSVSFSGGGSGNNKHSI